MEPIAEPIRMFGSTPDAEPLLWSWVDAQLTSAGTYWVVTHEDLDPEAMQYPHPRPVWGVWLDDRLHLSLGSPVLNRHVGRQPGVTVHLDSGTDVVIVEGLAIRSSRDESLEAKAAYDAKYDWDYDLDQYGPFTRVEPDAILAWRAIGPAGRDGFAQAGRWRFPDPDQDR
jgi:hypothetical protein